MLAPRELGQESPQGQAGCRRRVGGRAPNGAGQMAGTGWPMPHRGARGQRGQGGFEARSTHAPRYVSKFGGRFLPCMPFHVFLQPCSDISFV